jgi:hypothetical protein
MEKNSKSDKAYINTNPFASQKDTIAQSRVVSKEGKRPRIQKPVYTVRFL